MHAKLPVHGIVGGLKVSKQGHRNGEGGNFGEGDGGEAVVVEGGGQGVGGEASGERLGFECADAAAEGL